MKETVEQIINSGYLQIDSLRVNTWLRRMLSFLLFITFTPLMATSPTDILFVNTGRMNINLQPETGVTLFVPDAMRHLTDGTDSVKVILNGVLELGGNFYQDALTPVFDISGSTTKTASTGTIRFVSDRGAKRFITTWSDDITTFDRTNRVVAFPDMVLNTNDSLMIPPKMGLDASSLHRNSSKTGVMVLQSGQIGTNVFNASLRFPESGTSEVLVDAGTLVIEQYVKTYRNGTQLFAFATPFKNTQLSGYFAGNWVRRPLDDGIYGHTSYVLGNKTSGTNPALIDLSQYITNPLEELKTTQAYLIKPRPSGFSYSDLKTTGGLAVTGAVVSAYYQEKFVFNGNVYTLPIYQEQVFAEDVLFSKTIPQGTYIASTINLLIGNSYTSPISTQLLAQAMMNSELKFSPVIYVFPAGSTSYQPFDISGTGDGIAVTTMTEIPAMSIFMLRLSKGQTIGTNNTFSIGKNQLRHGNASHNSPAQIRTLQSTTTNQVVFRVSPEINANIYDLAAIGIRDSASEGSDQYDIAKVYNPGNEGFQLYTLSQSGSKLSANGLPPSAGKVILALKPALEAENYVLTASGQETLSTKGLWLEDTMTGAMVDLQTTPEYHFLMNTTDNINRFLVHFSQPITTGLTQTEKLRAMYSNGNLRIVNLTARDLQSTLTVSDLQGRIILQRQIDSYPDFTMPVDNFKGMYVAQLKGIRTAILKFIK